MKIKSQRDFASGLLFLVIGGGFAFIASNYRLGTAVSMGPGYFPFGIGLILAAVGIGVVLSSMILKAIEQSIFDSWDIRGLLVVLFSVCLFGLLIGSAGLVATVTLVTLVSFFADRDASWKGAIACAASVLAISLAIFSFLLKLQIPVWPKFIGG